MISLTVFVFFFSFKVHFGIWCFCQGCYYWAEERSLCSPTHGDRRLNTWMFSVKEMRIIYWNQKYHLESNVFHRFNTIFIYWSLIHEVCVQQTMLMIEDCLFQHPSTSICAVAIDHMNYILLTRLIGMVDWIDFIHVWLCFVRFMSGEIPEKLIYSQKVPCSWYQCS